MCVVLPSTAISLSAEVMIILLWFITLPAFGLFQIWSISRGVRLKTLTGHQSQIYAIAFDGINIATGSLDTSVRIWDAKSGYVI